MAGFYQYFRIVLHLVIYLLPVTPKKAVAPSLGIGDPGKLAKKLEEALNIEDAPSPPSPVEEKNSRKVPRKPRFVAQPVSQRKIMPKLFLMKERRENFSNRKCQKLNLTPPPLWMSLRPPPRV